MATPTAETTAAVPSSAAASASPNPSLYVGELHPDVSEAVLFNLFKPYGNVASIRICRDTVTRRSLGYAYINYQSVADAARAMKELNFYPIHANKPCRIMWAQRDPSLRRSGVGNLYVKSLDPGIDSKILYQMFSEGQPIGSITSVKVVMDEKGVSRGFGFVSFDSAEAAKQAMERLNGLDINGKKMSVMPFVPRALRANQKEWTNCYVKNIPVAWSDDKLKEAFAAHGDITSAVIMRDANGASKGFGFVNFKTTEQAEAAVKALHEMPLADAKPDSAAADGEKADGDDKDDSIPRLYVARFQRKQDRQRDLRNQFQQRAVEATKNHSNLFVKNIAPEVTDEELRAKFAPFGTITSAKVQRDPSTGLSRGFGYVSFATAEEAQKALNELNKDNWYNRPLFVSLHQRKDIRTQMLAKTRADRDARAQQQAQQSQMGAGAGLFRPQVAPGAGGVAGLNAAAGMQGINPMLLLQLLTNPALSQPGNQQALLTLLQLQQQQQMAQMGYPMQQQVVMQQAAQASQQQGAGAPVPVSQAAAQPQQAAMRPTQQAAGQAPPNRPQFASVVSRPATGPQQPGMGPRPGMQPPSVAGRPGMPGPPVGARPGMPGPAAGPRPGPGGVASAPVARPAAHMNVTLMPNAVVGGVPLNQPQQGAVPVQPAVAASPAPAAAAAQQSEFLVQLSKSTPEAQKNLIGEKLFPQIYPFQPKLAGKITGMLLEMEVTELLNLVESTDALNSKVNEAIQVLRTAGQISDSA